MPACPYAPHRLALEQDLRCRHCGGDLKLYAAARDLPALFYNRARGLWEESRFEEAGGWLAAALVVQPDLREAHWLLGAVAAILGRLEEARFHLGRARELGAEVEPETFIAGMKPVRAGSRRRKRRRRRRRSRPPTAPREGSLTR